MLVIEAIAIDWVGNQRNHSLLNLVLEVFLARSGVYRKLIRNLELKEI